MNLIFALIVTNSQIMSALEMLESIVDITNYNEDNTLLHIIISVRNVSPSRNVSPL